MEQIWIMPDFNHASAAKTTKADSRRLLVVSFRSCSLLLGHVCGIFVHFSSLAANYYLTFHHRGGDHHYKGTINLDDGSFMLSNLVWSFVTSSIAFSVLGVLRNVIGRKEELIVPLESLFSAGALGGLCSSWILTDIALGLRMRFQTSLCLLVLAAFCFKALLGVFDDRAARNESILVDNTMFEPLLEGTISHEAPVCHKTLRWMGIQSGLLIGIFIQLSGLGANSLIRFEDEEVGAARTRLILSVVWSFGTSSLGVAALFFIRQLLILGSPRVTVKSLVLVECFFAVGATIGLNLSWAATDYFLGVKPHFRGAVIATLVTFAWCKFILHCCVDDAEQSHPNEEVDQMLDKDFEEAV